MSDNTSLSIRVRRVDDLQDISLQPNAGDNNGIVLGGDDVFLVSHRGNDNGNGGYVTFSRKVALDTIRDYITSYSLQMLSGVSLSDLADGDSIMSEISEKMSQVPVQDSYTSNCYVRQSQYALQHSQGMLQPSGIHTFMQDINAQVHITLNASGSATLRTNATDLICLQMYTNDGWQTICSEPIIKGMVEVDFHGFFYAGTSIRATPVQLNADATNLSVASLFAGPSQMDVTEISNEKPFLTNSFSWRSSIPSNPSTASMSEPNTMSISANGFISFDGNFLNSNTETASKFTKTQKWTTPFVYGIQQLSSGTGINLANTYNPIPYGQTKAAAAVNDTFQQRMYYVQNDDGNISVRLSTDIKMYDKIGATNIAGYKNAALIQYVAADEISNVVDAFATDATIIDYNQVSGLSGQFENPDNYHTFTYGKYLGRPAGTTVLAFNNVTSDFGTPRKSLAFIGIGSEGPNFMRQSKGDRWVYSIGNPDGVECVQTNTLVKNDTFAISTVQGTYIDNPNSDELCGSVKFDYEVLDKNLTGLRCFPVNILSLNKALTASTTVNGKTEWSPKCINYHDIGAPLLSVRFAKNSTATIDDSAFAFCTSLKEIKIPETMSMNGNTTFFMGLSSNLNAQLLKVNNATPSISSINVVPQLSSVDFCYDAQPNKKTVGYPLAFVEIADQKALNNTFHGCANLSSVDLAATDAEQLVGTFMNCTGLKQVRMPLSLRTIDKYAFSGCKQLSNIVFDSNIGEVNVNSLDGIATQLTAENTNSTSGYKYQLGRDYVLGIRLSGDSYSNKNDVASEISAAVNALINTKPTKFSSSTRTSRRFKLYLNDGNPLKLDNAEQVYNPLVDVSGPLTADISFREFRIVDENTNPQC